MNNEDLEKNFEILFSPLYSDFDEMGNDWVGENEKKITVIKKKHPFRFDMRNISKEAWLKTLFPIYRAIGNEFCSSLTGIRITISPYSGKMFGRADIEFRNDKKNPWDAVALHVFCNDSEIRIDKCGNDYQIDEKKIEKGYHETLIEAFGEEAKTELKTREEREKV